MSKAARKLLIVSTVYRAETTGRDAYIIALLAVALIGCGKDPPSTNAASPPPSADEVQANTEASPPPVPAPDLGMPIDDYVAARLLERCALRYGEGGQDAETLAIDKLAGRPYQVPPLPGAAVPAAAPPTAAPPTAAAGPATAGSAAAEAVAAPDAQAVPPPAPALTKGGRAALGASDDGRVALYKAAIEKAKAYVEVERRVEDAVAACHFAPELGLIAGKTVDDYVDATVEITCLGQLIGKPGGPTDEVDHARKAGQTFARIGVDARGFSQLGLILARFPDVTTRIVKSRSERCADPRATALDLSGNGAFSGALTGPLAGTFAVTAQDGDAKGTLKMAGKRKTDPTVQYQLVGVVFDSRVHLQGGIGQDWIRLDSAKGTSGKGTWTAEIAFRKQSGNWTMTRNAPEGQEDPLVKPAEGDLAAPGPDPLGGLPAGAPDSETAAPPMPPAADAPDPAALKNLPKAVIPSLKPGKAPAKIPTK